MATAYAAITSLMHLMGDLHEHPHPPIKLHEEQVDSLNSKISFFQRFLEDHHATIALGLEIRIADAAYSVEDLIDSHIANRAGDQDEFNGSLRKAIQGLDLIKKEVMKMNWTEESSRGNNQPLTPSKPPSADSGGNNVVGIEDITIKIVDKLTQPHSYGRRIISLTGMGGIGKTTLALEVYSNPYIKNYFDICAWTSISRDYNTHESLVELLHCLDRKDSKESLREKSEPVLGDKLYKSLFGKRYLVILDDVWDVEAWDRLRSSFPDSRGSGIVMTTRESTVASIGSLSFGMNLLDRSKSWDLFCKKVFGQDGCPREVEDVGKKIENKCRGLPLSIIVIGGHLTKSPRTQEYWEYIVDNLSTVVNSENDNHCLKILSLSYRHLPIHLKPCFLYMGIFPEDQDIQVSKLIKLWVAEGFLKPINGKTLEAAAEDYLKDLIGRNLILVSESSLVGEIIKCRIHDLLRDLSLKEASEKKFLCILQKQVPQVSNNKRRIVVYEVDEDVDTIVVKSPSALRTLALCDTLPLVSLQVLASASVWPMEISLNNMVEVARHLVNVRCLDLSLSRWIDLVILPSSIFSIWNLQSLHIVGVMRAIVPEEIWKMSQLRQMSIGEFILSDPPSDSDDTLKNLQSVETILNFSFSEDLVRRIPNVKLLEVEYYGEVGAPYSLNNIARLEKLESLCCSFNKLRFGTTENGMLSNLTFPHSLKKLIINCLDWDDVTTKIGSLPLLEVLDLGNCWGSEWEHVEGQFVRLKFLKVILCYDLKCFTADVSHFPCLQELELHYMDSLDEISSDIGDIPSLRLIELYRCADSAVRSAKEVAEYQYNEMGNEELRVKVSFNNKSILSAESLSTSSNFHAKAYDGIRSLF